MITLVIPAMLIALAIVLAVVGPGRIMAAGAALRGRLNVRGRPRWLRRRDDRTHSSHHPR